MSKRITISVYVALLLSAVLFATRALVINYSSLSEPELKQMSRRKVIKNVFGGIYASLVGGAVFSGPASGSEPRHGAKGMVFQGLIDALRATGKAVPLAEADRLARQSVESVPRSFYLHLRQANLNASDASLIASALQSLTGESMSGMSSFSISYNPSLQQAGIVTLINSMPITLAEVGVVGCDMDDESAGVLLEWASRAVSLTVICLEDNRVSDPVKKRFSALRNIKQGLMVVV